MGDELCEGAHGGTVRMERRHLIPMREQHFELQLGVSGSVFRPAGGAGFALSCQRQRIDRVEDQKVIRAQGKDQRPFVECKAERHGLAVKARPQGSDPRVDRLGRMRKLQALPFGGTSCLETHIMCGIGPVDPHKGRTGGV